MAQIDVDIEITFDSDGFEAELLRRLALTSGTEDNIRAIATDLINGGEFMHIGPEIDVLDAEYLA